MEDNIPDLDGDTTPAATGDQNTYQESLRQQQEIMGRAPKEDYNKTS